MRAGLALSAGLHLVLIGAVVVTLRQPDAFNVPDVEALPVELVTIDDVTQVQEGAEDAPNEGPAAPEPVEAEEPQADAVNLGDNERDQATPETETQRTVEIDESRLPEPTEAPPPAPAEDTPREIVPVEPAQAEVSPEAEPLPTPDTAPVREAEPTPAPEAEPAPAPEPESVTLPDTLPIPTQRPERLTAPDQRAETEPDPVDEVASLLNRERGSGGGAASSEQTASVGATRTTGGTTLTQNEMDALRNQIQSCWNVPAGVTDADQLRVSIRFNLDRNGRVEGRPAVTASSGNRAADDSAMRAIMICNNRFDGFSLPAEKYEAWREVVVNFDPSEMF